MEKSKFDAIDEAIYDGDCEKITALICDGIDANARSESEGWNFLHMALMSVTSLPDPAIVQHLVGLGVDVNAKDSQLWTPLHFAVRSKSSESVCVLLEAGAIVDAPNSEGITPLHVCFMKLPPSLEIASILISSGANPDKDYGSGTVRNYAITAVGSDDADKIHSLLNRE